MKSRTSIFVGLIFVASLVVCISSLKMAAQATTEGRRSPVIVELFTSEGCSTCPTADALLAKLDELQPIEGADVIALEEHVNYWNQQGWIDPFSSIEWTQRQQIYVAKFKENSPYTPEMVVDGESQFTGNRPQEAVKAIQDAAQKPKTAITVTTEKSGGESAQKFNVSVGKVEGVSSGDSTEVWLAVTEKGLHTDVKAGENSGHDLHHASVVRMFKKIGNADASKGENSFVGNTSIKMKSNWKQENLQVVVFLQEKKSRRILGATAIKVMS